MLGGSLRVGVAEATAAKAERKATVFILSWLVERYGERLIQFKKLSLRDDIEGGN